MQVSVKNTDVLASLLTDHSPITFSCFKNEESNRGRGLWKFNNSLIENEEYLPQIKKIILYTLNQLFNENILDDQVKWEYLKCNIRKCTIKFSKELAKNTNKTIDALETNLKHYEKLENYVDNIDYKVCKQQLDEIYEKKAKGIKIRSKCNWYDHGEKSTKYFLYLEKNLAIQSQIHSVVINQDEIADQDEINKQIFSFYQSLFSRKMQFQTDIIEAYLDNIPLPKLTDEQTLSCEGIISEDEVFKSLKSMDNNKSPGNDGLSKEFYECFWDEVKNSLLASIYKEFLNQKLSTSQKQALIKILEKKNEDKRFIKNWRPVPLLNKNMEIISKVLSTKIKGVLPYLISSNQTAYVKNRFLSENGRLISDILEIAKTIALEGYLVTIDIEKEFDSVNHCFLLQILGKC